MHDMEDNFSSNGCDILLSYLHLFQKLDVSQ